MRIEQDRAEVIVERRTPDGGWRAERFLGLEAVARLSGTLGMVDLPLAELYERVTFEKTDAGA